MAWAKSIKSCRGLLEFCFSLDVCNTVHSSHSQNIVRLKCPRSRRHDARMPVAGVHRDLWLGSLLCSVSQSGQRCGGTSLHVSVGGKTSRT